MALIAQAIILLSNPGQSPLREGRNFSTSAARRKISGRGVVEVLPLPENRASFARLRTLAIFDPPSRAMIPNLTSEDRVGMPARHVLPSPTRSSSAVSARRIRTPLLGPLKLE